MKLYNRKGFTLIELIVVIAVLAVLTMILVPSLSGYTKNSKEVTADSNAYLCYESASMLQAENKVYTKEEFEKEMVTLMGESADACEYFTGDVSGDKKGVAYDYSSETITRTTWKGSIGEGEYKADN